MPALTVKELREILENYSDDSVITCIGGDAQGHDHVSMVRSTPDDPGICYLHLGEGWNTFVVKGAG